jgi:hypothetical protein
MLTRLLLALLLLLSAPARAVVDGELDPNTLESAWAGVGSVTVAGGVYSGVLIGPHHVLTAAHVVANRFPEEISFNLNAGGDLTHRLRAEAVYVRPGYVGAVGFKPGGQFDLAVIRLAEPAPAGVPFYSLYDSDLPQGTIITFVGYGAGGLGVLGPTEAARPHIKRTGSNMVECFAFTVDRDNCDMIDLAGNGPRALYLFDFDAPALPGAKPNGRLPFGEATLAGGDSGSPSFVHVQGQWRIAGINTFVTRDGAKGRTSVFGTAGGGVLVSGENGDWVRSIIAPAERGLLPPPNPTPHVPEPHTWFLLGFGLLNVGVAIWRQVRRSGAR